MLLQACLAAHKNGITNSLGGQLSHTSPAQLMSDAAGMPAPAQQQQVLGQVTPHLPARAPAAQPGPQLKAALTRLNLAWAKLLARFLPAACGDVPRKRSLACWLGNNLMHEVLIVGAELDAAADHNAASSLSWVFSQDKCRLGYHSAVDWS